MTDSFSSVRIHPAWVNQVLAHEHNDVRFEAFANKLVSILEGKPIVSTSKSWDLARDGRGLGSRQGTFVLTTLRTEIDKPRTDAARLKDTAWRIQRVYYVAPRLISEVVLEEHCKEIRSILGEDVPVDPIGGPQISDLVSSGKVAQAFKQHYAGELDSIKTALAPDTDNPESKHLELALYTFGAKNTQELRVALSSRLILGLLDKKPLSLIELATSAATVLGVAAFSESSIEYYCGFLKDSGRIDLKGPRYEITDLGRQKLVLGDERVVESGLSGRDAVRKAVEESLGTRLQEQQWNHIWTALQKELARAFYVRGKQVLDVISTLLDGDTSTVHRDILADLVDNILTSIIRNHVSVPNRSNMLRALKDAFLPGDQHGAFEWLAGVAGRFAATCTLGLPAEIASALAEALKKIRCFIDTDVVISYLCAHEPSSAAAHAIVNLNRRLTNQVMITAAVAEETARHAMKAYTDYKVRVAPITGTMQWYEIAELESAFTREFEYLRKEGKVKARDWPRFIDRYAGEETRGFQQRPNTSKMRRLLSSESFSIRHPLEDTRWAQQRETIATEMCEEAMRRHPDGRPDITKHKSRIDAEMLITMSRMITDSQENGTGERYIVITSARRLQNLPGKIKAQLPDLPEVLSLAEAATIASLLPEHSISLDALHALLFEGHFSKTIGGLEALFLRIVRESSSVVLPGATRGVLCEEFGAAILRESRLTGEAQSKVRQRIDRDPIEFARIAAVAVDSLALRRPQEREDVLRRIEEALAARNRSPEPSL